MTRPDRPTRRRTPRVYRRDLYRYRIERGPTNAIVYRAVTIDGTLPVAVLWNGPGARLRLLWHDASVAIDMAGCADAYASETDATDAFVRYMDAIATAHADRDLYATTFA